MTAHGSASFLSRVGRPKAPPPKEKFASIMEGVFDGTLAGLARKPAEFWDELFLLGCNARALTELVASSTPDTLHRRREEITTLCQRASERIDDGALLRRSRALELLCVLLLQIARAPFPERSLGVIDTCAGGQESCDAFFADLISRCAACAANHDLPVALRRLAVRCMLTVVCAVDDNVNRNALVRYFMTDDVYEPVMKVLIAPVDVPGGGVSSETHEDATALAHGAGGFGPGAREGDRNGDETEDRRRARKGAALGTTKERSMLREEAGCLLALLLSWRETRNAYTLRLSDADGVEMSVILRAVCSMLAAPARGEDSNERAAAAAAAHADGLTADAGAWMSSITANVAAAVRGAREPEDLMGDLARRLGFDDDDAAGGDDGSRGWELGPGPCAALLLLHAVVRDSGLLRKPAIWLELTPKPDEMLHGVPVGQRWREALGRVLCFIRVLCRGRRGRRMRRNEPGGGARSLPAGVTVHTVIGEVTAEEEQGWWDWITGAAAAASPYKLSSTRRRLGKWVGTGSRGTGRWIENDGETADEELAASTALLAVSLLRALLDDASAAEFLHAVDARRLAPEKKSHPERTEETEGTSADFFSLASSLGAALGLPGGARESAASSVRGSPPVASAVLELLSSVLAEGAPGGRNSTSPAAVESHAVYVIHRALETQVARGGRLLPVRWERLWLGLMSTLRRCADGGADALASPHVAALVSQCVNLINFVLARRGALCQSDDDVVPLVNVIREEESVLAAIEHGAGLNGYLVDAADVASMARRRDALAADEDFRDGDSRRAGVRMETVHAVQSHFRSLPIVADEVVMRKALQMFRAPVGDALDAVWALGTTLGGGGGGTRGWLGGDAARMERAAASSARALVGELLKGPLGSVPAGLRPKIRVPG